MNLKTIIAVTLISCASCFVMGQNPPVKNDLNNKNKIVVRIKINHADPALIAWILSGKQQSMWQTSPEISTVNKK